MSIIWTIVPIGLLVYGTFAAVLNQMAWRDFRKRKFSTFEEKQKFRRMISWSSWGSYRYLSAVRQKDPTLLPYVKILAATGLLLSIWTFGKDAPLAARVMITPVALAMFYEAYVLIKNHHPSREYKKAHD